VVAEAPLDRLPMYARAGSIVPMGPVLQSTADVEDPIELRIYGGRDADFVLYEDSGDGYAYEHGERAIVSMHWNDKQRELLLSARNGSFAGMRAKRTFNVVLVSEGRGTGVGICAKPDQTVVYEGHPMKVHLRRTEQ
jgi:alpha-D-xyloside xylohydrolase